LVDKGLRDEGQCRQGRIVVLDGKDVFDVDDVKGVDGVDEGGRENGNGVEEVADQVILCEPAVLAGVVEGGVEGGRLVEDLFS
jgi:hypothetical protein